MKKEYKNILNDYIVEHKGAADRHELRGGFGYSYNDILDYISVYKIENLNIFNGYYYINNYPYKLDNQDAESYDIKDYFFQGVNNYADVLGKNFLNNSSDTQFKKIREYFRECDF